MKFSLSIIAALAVTQSAHGFAGMNMNQASSSNVNTDISRRESFANVASIIGGVAGVGVASAFPSLASAFPSDETPRVISRMGGLLERYGDTQRGLSLLVPSGWNKFEGEVGAYDLKWQDLVDPKENIKISSTPVKSTTTSINALGDDVQALGQKLAAKRDAKLMKAEERLTDSILFYTFEFAINDGTHQILCLCVHKGKIWSLDANTTEKRWSKRDEMYNNVAGSFIPKL